MKRLAAFLLTLSILVAVAFPAIEPAFAVLAQGDESVSAQQGSPESEPPPVEEIPTDTPVPTDVPAPTDTTVPTDVPAPTMTNTATDIPVLPADTPSVQPSATSSPTPFKNFHAGDLVKANVNVNCREAPNATILMTLAKGDQAILLAEPVSDGSLDWVKLLKLNTTTECYSAAKYFDLVQAGYGLPTATSTSTSTRTATSTPSSTSTPSNTPTVTDTPTETLTPTVTDTPTETPTLTGSETATFTTTPTDTPTETPTATNTLEATLTPTPTYKNLHTGDLVATNQSVNCRSANSASSTITRVLAKNDRAVLLTDPTFVNGYNWVQLRPLGTSVDCFVAANYLDLIQSGYALTPTAVASGTATSNGPFKVGDIVQTTTSVNMRTGPGSTNPIVKSISSGSQGSVMAGYEKVGADDWVQVQFASGNGWVVAKYLKLITTTSPGGPFANGEKIVVTGTVNLRLYPGTSSPSLGQLSTGQQGIALGQQAKIGTTTWVQVEFPLGTGWVSTQYVKKLSSVTPTIAPSAANIWVYLDCTSNPERVIVQNNNLSSIRVISIGSTYQPSSGEPYSVGDTLGTKVTLSYQSNSKASGNFMLTTREIFDNNVGSQEGVVVKTSLGDITQTCPSVTTGEKWIEVNLTTQTMKVWRGSTMISSSLVSTGKPGFTTPSGTFSILAKYESVTMAACANGECWNTPGVPWDMLFRSGGFYIHGAYWHHDFGKVRSHGCVNLPVPYAEWLYGWTPLGTRVWIHY